MPPYDPEGAALDDDLAPNARYPRHLTLDERMMMVELKLDEMTRILQNYHSDHQVMRSMADDLEQLVQGLRWARTTKTVTLWSIAILAGLAGSIKFLLPSLQEWMK
jgi:hypothetical protein